MSTIPAAYNEPNDIKIRKFRDTLVTGGLAVIGFGIWTVIKSILEAFTILEPMIGSISVEELNQVQAEQVKAMIEDNSLFYFFLFMILAFLAVDLTVRVFVGLSSRAVGLQKKKRNGKERSGIIWLIFGIILAAFGIYSVVVTLIGTGEILRVHSVMYYVISLFVDVTSIIVTVELVITGFRLRALVKKQNDIGEVRDAA
jgi:hypothetical protein